MSDVAPLNAGEVDRPEVAVGPLLALRGVRAGYDGIEVLHGVDLAVAPGEVLAVLGPNGAGKTTTLRVIAGPVSYTHLTLPTNREV